jgi:hypothetical protein
VHYNVVIFLSASPYTITSGCRDAALEASEGYRKKERLYALREKQAELALSRVQSAEKENLQQEKLLAHKGKALMQAQAELADSRSKCGRCSLTYLRRRFLRSAASISLWYFLCAGYKHN